MKRITLAVAVLLTGTLMFSAFGVAAPGGGLAHKAAPLAKPPRKKAAKPKLPPLPCAPGRGRTGRVPSGRRVPAGGGCAPPSPARRHPARWRAA